MANKIINYTQESNQLKKTRLDVYRDVDLISQQNITKISNNNEYKPQFKINKLTDIDSIRNSLHNIFTWQQGERILLPDFGTRLRAVLYNGITTYNIELVTAEIRNAITKWEPRVVINDIINIRSQELDDNNTIHLEIIYSIPSLTEEQFNYTFAFNTSE